ncbi:MAG: CopG family transcriptional regulator [Dermatophilus congolensis]|nr:CopG family transcriptional regulator [Dermatophilus congolensis]
MTTAEEEYEFYADPAHQVPVDPTPYRRRKRAPMSNPVPTRYPTDLLDAIRRHADTSHVTLSTWLRQAAYEKLERERSAS